ncbi:helix-turn-helix domain-containing protein [Opitutaceae bacterium TAV3]|nr:helix-turn-helix domain-containing protein [Opitutaceae bacterium TAV3]
MLVQKIQELTELRLRIAKLAANIEQERTAELAAIPSQYGYSDVNDFIKVLKKVVGVRGKRDKKATKASTAKPEGKKARAKITPELKEQVKAAVLEGKTGSAIAVQFGISVPSVQNIKKEFGLVAARAVATPVSTPSGEESAPVAS